MLVDSDGNDCSCESEGDVNLHTWKLHSVKECL